MPRSIASLALVAALTAASAAPAWAQAQNPTLNALTELGGAMHASAEICGGYTATELSSMKAQQKAQSQQQGISASEFEAGFQKGYQQGKTRFVTASPAEKAKACEQLKALMRAQPR